MALGGTRAFVVLVEGIDADRFQKGERENPFERGKPEWFYDPP